MAKKITIPITDHGDASVCTTQYKVEYKLSGMPSYTTLPPVFTDTVEISNLVADADYDIRITRQCCNGAESVPAVLTVHTS